MKKGLRTLLILVLSAGAAQAQFTPVNDTVKVNLAALKDTTVLGLVSPNFYETEKVTPKFFGNIAGLAYKVRAINYGPTGSFTSSGSDLLMTNATSNNVGKIAVHTIKNAQAVAKFSFVLDLSAFSGNSLNSVVIAFGNSGITGSTATLINSSAPTAANVADMFGNFKATKVSSGGVLITGYKKDPTLTGYTNALDNLIKSGVSQTVEVFVNNATVSTTYRYKKSDTGDSTLAAGVYHVYVDGVKHKENFSKLSAFPTYPAANSSINTLSVTLTGNVATQESVKLSNFTAIFADVATLPVTLTSFTGQKSISGVRLNWKTASELNNDHFDVLRSADGQAFNTLATVSGNGTSSQANSYSYLDNAPVAGTNYYKLKQVDKNGAANISDIVVAVNNDLNENQTFTASLHNDNFKVNFKATQDGSASVNLTDLSGRVVFTKSFTTTKGLNNFSASTNSLNAGVYVATLVQNGKTKSIKIIK